MLCGCIMNHSTVYVHIVTSHYLSSDLRIPVSFYSPVYIMCACLNFFCIFPYSSKVQHIPVPSVECPPWLPTMSSYLWCFKSAVWKSYLVEKHSVISFTWFLSSETSVPKLFGYTVVVASLPCHPANLSLRIMILLHPLVFIRHKQLKGLLTTLSASPEF